MPLLGVNIDHIATIRQARYRGSGGPGAHAGAGAAGEPDPVRAAHEAELGGAEIITVHLREDRRHVNDRDVYRLKDSTALRLNLEMAATEEMAGIAGKVRPHMCTLVPEGRTEVTTEGGLDVDGQLGKLKEYVARLRDLGAIASAFVDADPRQIDAAHRAGFAACEIHTGPYAAAFGAAGGDFIRPELVRELDRVRDAGRRISAAGMRFNAGHALNYTNVREVAQLPEVAELHIGHAIVSRAVFTGLREAVREMRRLMGG